MDELLMDLREASVELARSAVKARFANDRLRSCEVDSDEYITVMQKCSERSAAWIMAEDEVWLIKMKIHDLNVHALMSERDRVATEAARQTNREAIDYFMNAYDAFMTKEKDDE